MPYPDPGRRGAPAVATVALVLLSASGSWAGARAETVVVGAPRAGPPPGDAAVGASFTGGTLASVTFVVEPKAGSFTRPIEADAPAAYLAARGELKGNNVTVPVFGLYAGSNNTVDLFFNFTDGTTVEQVVPIATGGYVDPCAEVNAPVLTQNRRATSDLNFDYFILKDYCSVNSPAIFDTDGHVRWVGTANAGSLPGEFYENGIYTSDGKSGVNRLDLDGTVTKIGDYAAQSVTSTNTHNIDVGRNGLLVDVNTNTEYDASAIEVDGATGAVLNGWNLGNIIGRAMEAGGDDPSQFVRPDGKTDWFHLNATAYDPADDTLIASSRENFVIAVDYDPPADGGERRIHWILGDPTKKWYQFASLRKYALTLAPGTAPPVGQHAVSVGPGGNLILFDDGFGSQFQSPPGVTRHHSALRKYRIDAATMTATAGYVYAPQPVIYSYVCGSAYEAPPGNYLIDFATADGDLTADIQGLGASQKLVFDLKLPQTSFCAAGWNASIFPGTIQY